MTKPATVSYGPSSGTRDAGALEQFVGAEACRGRSSQSVRPDDAGAGAVVLVGDLADEFLDEVLERGDAGGAAVLVDDDGHLVAAPAQLAEQQRRAASSRARAATSDCRADDRHIRPLLARHRDGLLDVHEADDVVDVLVDDREAGVAGRAREVETSARTAVAVDGRDARARAS